METRVRDLIDSLQKFDPDTRLEEGTFIDFKWNEKRTALKVRVSIGKTEDAAAHIDSLMSEVKDLHIHISGLEDDIIKLSEENDNLAGDLKESRKSLEIIRNAL